MVNNKTNILWYVLIGVALLWLMSAAGEADQPVPPPPTCSLNVVDDCNPPGGGGSSDPNGDSISTTWDAEGDGVITSESTVTVNGLFNLKYNPPAGVTTTRVEFYCNNVKCKDEGAAPWYLFGDSASEVYLSGFTAHPVTVEARGFGPSGQTSSSSIVISGTPTSAPPVIEQPTPPSNAQVITLSPKFDGSMTHYGSGGVTYSNGVASVYGDVNADPSHIVWGYSDGKPGDIITYEFDTRAGSDVTTTWDNGCGGGWDIDFGASDGYVIRNTFNGPATRNKDWTHVKYVVVIPQKDTTPRLTGQTLISTGAATWTFTNLVTGVVQTNTGSSTSSGGENMGGRGGLTFPSTIRYRFWYHNWFGSQSFCEFRNPTASITRSSS